MYVRPFRPDDRPLGLGEYPYGIHCADYTYRKGSRRFIGAADGRIEVVDSEDETRGVLPQLEIEALGWEDLGAR